MYRYRTDSLVNLLGQEPPLFMGGGEAKAIERRPVNWRWMAGAVLTAAFGTMIMSAAVFTALDRQTRFARAPEVAQKASRESLGPNILRKGDRLVPFSETVTSRQTMRIALSTRVNDRDVVRQRSFTKVSASLVTVTTLDNIPAFNPLKLVSDGGLAIDKLTPQDVMDDSDMAISFRDMPANLLLASPELTEPEARQAALDALRAGKHQKTALPTLALNPGALQGATEASTADDVKVQTENVTIIGKSSMTSSRGGLIEKSALIRSGQNAPDILKSLGIKPNVASTMLRTLQVATDKNVTEGHRVNVLFLPSSRQQDPEPLRMSVFAGEDLLGVVAQTDSGRWIVVKAEPSTGREEEEELTEEAGVPLYRSLYETALKQGVPRTVIEEITRVFAYDIDLQRPVNAGDSFDVFFADDQENGQHDVLFAALTIRGEQRQFYRFQSQDDGAYDYYDEDGRSARRFLMRKPISGGTFRSGFGMRRHPILRYSRMHTGVDWSDRVGTPILAAGNGKVLKAEWDSGYGRRVEIEHANGYVTTYSHLSAFGRNIKEGIRVRQGQVIGYLGSSGLSTGPHLHYEVMINGRFVDPLRIKLPRGRELDGRVLADFRRERTRIDGYMSRNVTAGN